VPGGGRIASVAVSPASSTGYEFLRLAARRCGIFDGTDSVSGAKLPWIDNDRSVEKPASTRHSFAASSPAAGFSFPSVARRAMLRLG